MSFSPDRREFFKKLALFGLVSSSGAWLSACDDDSLLKEEVEGGVFQVWKEMQQLIQSSQTCLTESYLRVKESRDPKKMLEFVRDSIYLIPANASSLRGMGTALRQGTRGVLRDGFATPREKAELLVQLFAEAGISAEVVYERTDFDEEKVKTLFFRAYEEKILADLDDTLLDRWMKMLKVSESDLPTLTYINSEEKDAGRLAEKIWDLLPEKEQIRYHKFDFRWDNSRCPAVRFQWNGQEQIAHLFDSSVSFGNAFDLASTVKLADPAEYVLAPIEFSLSYRDNITPEEETILLSKTYQAQELVGRQLHLGFYHGLDLLEQASTSFNQVRVFTPAISIQSPDLNEQEQSRLAEVGQTVTLEADRIEVNQKEKSLRINGFQIEEGKDSSVAKEVASLQLKVSAGLPSLVKVSLWPMDEKGKPVEGLNASDFTFSENGMGINPLMESNEFAPKVLILYDTSLSMPLQYRNEGMNEFLNTLENGIRQNYPKASLSSWATDSALYQWMRKASLSSFDLILFATDGDNQDELKEGDLDTFQAGPPVIVLDVTHSTRGRNQEVFANLSLSSDGKIIDARDQKITQEEIIRQLGQMDLPPYVFTFYGSLQQEKNLLRVSLDEDRIFAEETYEFKFRDKTQAIGPKIIGVYLRIKIGNQNIEKVLAGWDPVTDKADSIGKNHSDEVRNFLFGSLLIGVEGQGPTYANALNELLNFRLSHQARIEALKNENLEETLQAMEKSNWIYDPLMIHLLSPLPDQVTTGSLTFASGIRMVLLKRTVGINQEFSEDSVDILPTADFVTISADVKESFQINLRKTAHLALIEDAFFEESTYSLLSDSGLISTELAKERNWFDDHLRDGPNISFIRENWFRGDSSFKLFSEELHTMAYWQIHRQSGELLGILPDLTGGGKRKIYTRYDDLNTVIQNYTRTLNKNPGRSIGFLGFHLMLLRLYAIASHAIKTMDTSNLEEDVLKALQMDACEAAHFIHSGLSGRPQKIMGGLANLIRLMDKTTDEFPCK